ncbi:hypothetical protein [Soonwooa sp.]|uniref:hypothetical protein n=1 Tax=Soonwooa sp. TaxID=1938592 RepID=UPI0028A58977|nr:hypothetical protein [Soonwooa sp.]
MKAIFIASLFVSTILWGQSYKTPFEQGNGKQTTTYATMRSYYQQLAKDFKTISYLKMGKDDNGEPIEVVIFNPYKQDVETLIKTKSVLLINNGIHPGEPDGIDATMAMMRDFATKKLNAPQNILIAAIAAYNVSGMMNRGQFSRANQNGPEQYGFRGNARNYDLNRDFIKTDTKNSWSFQKIYQYFQPDVFIDNHVSNGADYQYTFTYISTNKERLGKPLGNYFHQNMQPEILKSFTERNILSVPYVNIHGDVPDKGFPAFVDSPRYATGYTTLFNSIGTVVETHMLKPYKDRVAVTYDYMLESINYMEKNYQQIKQKRQEARNEYKIGQDYPLRWKLDSTKYSQLDFKGFEAGYKPSVISGKPRLYYDRNKKFSKPILYYDTYTPISFVKIPKYYVIPQSEYHVIDLLKLNNIEMKTIKKDSLISVEQYRIRDFKTVQNPYEGHYLHYETVVGKENTQKTFRTGDVLLNLNQNGMKFLLEILEPEAVDSYFNWNFFDAILGQKEYYSAYVFEDTAEQLINNDKALKTAFELEKAKDPKFAQDGAAQLDWVYKNSPYYEKTHRLYPVFRIN